MTNMIKRLPKKLVLRPFDGGKHFVSWPPHGESKRPQNVKTSLTRKDFQGSTVDRLNHATPPVHQKACTAFHKLCKGGDIRACNRQVRFLFNL